MRQTSKKIFAFAAAYIRWIDLKRLTSVLAALATLHSRTRMLAPLVLLLRRSSALTVLVVSIDRPYLRSWTTREKFSRRTEEQILVEISRDGSLGASARAWALGLVPKVFCVPSAESAKSSIIFKTASRCWVSLPPMIVPTTQAAFITVMFSQACVKNSVRGGGGMHGGADVHGMGHAWRGVGVCMTGGMRDRRNGKCSILLECILVFE